MGNQVEEQQFWSGFNVVIIKRWSESIEWFAYDPANKILAVTFQAKWKIKASTYLYKNLNQDLLVEFVRGAGLLNSWERAFNETIRDSIKKNKSSTIHVRIELCDTPEFNWGELGRTVLNWATGIPLDIPKFCNWLCESPRKDIDWSKLTVNRIDSELSF